jgi:hypothetical protein
MRGGRSINAFVVEVKRIMDLFSAGGGEMFGGFAWGKLEFFEGSLKGA